MKVLSLEQTKVAGQNNYTSQTKLSSFLILWSVFRFSPIVPRHSLISIFNSFRSSFVMIDKRAANDRIAAPVPGAALKLKRNCTSKLVRINRIIYSMPSSGESRPSDKGVPRYPGSDRHSDKWGRGRLKKNFFRPFGPQFHQRWGGSPRPLHCIRHCQVLWKLVFKLVKINFGSGFLRIFSHYTDNFCSGYEDHTG